MLSLNTQNNISMALAAALLSACASYSGTGLKPGLSTTEDVLKIMGPPAMQWKNADGSLRMSYPRGPAGPHSIMVNTSADGRLKSIGNVLEYKHFAKIVAGKTTQEEVLRILGPSIADWTTYYKSRDELVWGWRYCEPSTQQARFFVLFDGMNGLVRTTQSLPDYQGRDGMVPRCGEIEPLVE